MTETIRITVNHLALLIFLSTMAGFLVSTLVLKYYFARRRARKMSPSQSEMMRLADYLATHHADQVSAYGTVTDVAIRLIDKLYKKSEIIT